MEKIELEPAYSTVNLPGKCVKCLAEQQYGDCLRQLLRDEGSEHEMEEKFEAVLSLLKSPELISLRDEAEKQLANGKRVKLIIERNKDNEPEYRIEVL
jgi:hypothetical protein